MKYVLAALVTLCVAWYVLQMRADSQTAEQNRTIGAAFLAENAQKDGVQVTSSGLQYRVLKPGHGSTHPSATDSVKVHYHGTFIDNRVFDSSVDRGETITFSLDQVIPGWTEGLQLMVEGEKTRLFIPSDLAYGDRAAGPIEPGSTLIFDVELLGINVE